MNKFEAIDKAKPLIEKYVSMYRTSSFPDNLLRSEAEIIVANASSEFDEDKGNFFGFMDSKLNALKRIVNQSSMVYIPENRAFRFNKFNDIYEGMVEKLKRQPSIEEFADELKVSVNEASRFMQESSRKIMGLDEIEHLVESPFAKKEDESSLLNYVYGRTSNPSEKKVMEYTFGLNNSPVFGSNVEMASKLGVSEATVRRLKDKIITNIRENDLWETAL